EATGNITAEIRHGDAAATAAAFKRAAHVVSLDLVNQRVAPCPIEPRAVLAEYDAVRKRITLRLSCQTPTGIRDELGSPVLRLAADRIRSCGVGAGGGFGMQTSLYPEDVVLAHCVRKLGRPLKWRAERLEEFLAAGAGRDLESKIELAFDASGKIVAL